MKNPAAVALGTLGGRSKSDKKTAASRENGKLGGYPKGRPRKEVTVVIGVDFGYETKQ